MSHSPAFLERLVQHWPVERWQSLTVLLAVSGGADSVALLHAMQSLAERDSGRLAVAHFNHRLRPSAAEDEQFVRQLCQRFELPCHVGHAESELAAQAGGEGIEAVARRARYRFLQQTAEQLGARYVATAHTADDQAETILHHIVRGTGLAGLSGIKRTRPLGAAVTLVRPLLFHSRQEVLQYLAERGEGYRVDETNRDLRFTRNRIRHDLLPKLRQEYNAEVDVALRRLGQLADESQAFVQRQVAELLEKHVRFSVEHDVQIDCAALRTVDPYLLRELLMALWRRNDWPLRAMGFEQWHALSALVLCELRPREVRQQIFPGAVRVRREGEFLSLDRQAPSS